MKTMRSDHERNLLLAWTGAVCAFLATTILVLANKTLSLDTSVSRFLYSLRTPFSTDCMFAITRIAGVTGVIIVALTVSLFLSLKNRRATVFFITVFCISVAANVLFKALFKIPRPTLSPLQNLADFSYPSGHAMNNASLYSLILYLLYRTGKRQVAKVLIIPAMIWVFFIGFSRIFLGSHYLSDVVGGVAAGVGIVAGAILVLRALQSLLD